ncbi:Beta-fructofuranosidase, soluble isoenzyme I [Asimina triloba]
MSGTGRRIQVPGDPEEANLPNSYAPLLDRGDGEYDGRSASNGGKSVLAAIALASSALLLMTLGLIFYGESEGSSSGIPGWKVDGGRGVREGVSLKSVRMPLLRADKAFPWTNDTLQWQRTAFHFQPQKNWLNGPLFYKGWYHIFYQYNPDSAVWGNITWGHAVSSDLIHWRHLPLAIIPDRWYDINGVWTGSATILANGSLIMLYTSATDRFVQVQNLAFPADPSDPLLLNWKKYDGNPILVPPPGIGEKDFRDPTTAWLGPDGKWRMTIGSKLNRTGLSLVYKTSDFISYELIDDLLHAVPDTGMWECVDFYPVSTGGKKGLDNSENGPGVKHVMKASMDDTRIDYYAIGTYDQAKETWTPDNPALDVGIGLRYDYGRYYASKTFYDQNKKRRVLWSWVGEADSEQTDVNKGWASLLPDKMSSMLGQGVPREVLFDEKTGTNLLQWPVEELESLRTAGQEFNNIDVRAGAVVPFKIGMANQLDIVAEFEVSQAALDRIAETSSGYSCSASNGAAGRGVLGPFGFLVLADEKLSEQTAIYFYIGKGIDGSLKTFFCQDESRHAISLLSDFLVSKTLTNYKAEVENIFFFAVMNNELFDLVCVEAAVDHSIVESFAQGGRTCITSRVYPTEAINEAARVFLFNNATGADVKATSVKIWQMDSASICPFV